VSDEGHGIAASARDLVRGLAEKAGLEELKASLEAVEAAGRRSSGDDAEVWTAVPLASQERDTLESRLKARYGDRIAIRYHVDPALMGGVVLRVGDKYIDGSLATRLGQLRQELVSGRTA
jgi:F-type H+-transporting ATPase subunit delta